MHLKAFTFLKPLNLLIVLCLFVNNSNGEQHSALSQKTLDPNWVNYMRNVQALQRSVDENQQKQIIKETNSQSNVQQQQLPPPPSSSINNNQPKQEKTSQLNTIVQQLYMAQAHVQLEATEIQRAQSIATAAQQDLEEASNNVRVITAALHAAQESVANAALRAQTAQLQLAAHDQLLFTARQKVDALSAQMVGLQAEVGISEESNKITVDLPGLMNKLKEPLKENEIPKPIQSIAPLSNVDSGTIRSTRQGKSNDDDNEFLHDIRKFKNFRRNNLKSEFESELNNNEEVDNVVGDSIAAIERRKKEKYYWE